jgi:nitric oxide reductase NorD protein
VAQWSVLRKALAPVTRAVARVSGYASVLVEIGRAGRPRRDRHVVRLDDVRRRLELLVTAVYDRTIPITVAEPPKRRPRSLWQLLVGPRHLRGGGALPATDGERIQLPREIESADTDGALAAYRLMAVEQAERIARGTSRLLGAAATAVERDLYLLRESVAVDAAIDRSVPGLRAALTTARTLALAGRPALNALSATERAVEQLVRRSLATEPRAALTMADDDGGDERQAAEPTPDASLAWARRRAAEVTVGGGRYRGVAPVALWGTVTARARPEAAAPPRKADELATLRGSRFGVGYFGRGSGKGGNKSSERGEDEGTTDAATPDVAAAENGKRRIGATGTGSAPASAPGTDSDEPHAHDTTAEPEVDSEGQPEPDPVAETMPVSRPTGKSSRTPSPRVVGQAMEYPEWDWEAGAYGVAGAIVHAREPDMSDDTWGNQVLARYGPIVRRLRERFERLRARRARLDQQRDGDELDLAACVRALVDQHAGYTVDDRLYIAVRPARRGLAITLLIDISGSTDEWIDRRRRVIDVEKVALLLASEALDALGDLYSVLTFSGKGRTNVRMRTIKDFAEPNGPLIRRRIAALEPEGYTRAGAAIRHAAALLCRQPAAHRLLLLISDGKPNDVDGYEGLAGVEDTRRAIFEARRDGVYPFCLTIDRQGQEYLARIFGEAGHAILRNPDQLPLALVKVVRHLLAS